jgi:hypothetical protein
MKQCWFRAGWKAFRSIKSRQEFSHGCHGLQLLPIRPSPHRRWTLPVTFRFHMDLLLTWDNLRPESGCIGGLAGAGDTGRAEVTPPEVTPSPSIRSIGTAFRSLNQAKHQ